MHDFSILGLGFVAQGLFSARFIIQLFQSEKANKVVSPTLFWQLSFLASLLLILYGFLRNDIVIVGGQLIGYLIYIRNLQIKGQWEQFPFLLRRLAFYLPGFIVLFLVFGLEYDWARFIHNPEINGVLLTWGTFGQVIFTSRFVVQWLYSEKMQESAFPLSFWYISAVGALFIIVYAVFRKDAVLFIGQGFGLIVYSRNLFLHQKANKKDLRPLLERFKLYRLPVLLILTALILFFNLGIWSVTETSEARYAQIAKEMTVSGDYLHPTLMGIHHYHKPPMTYWLTAAAYKIFGISAFSARFFLQIAVLFQVFLIYRIGQLVFDNTHKAFLSAMLYTSFPVVIIASRGLTTDAYLATFSLASVFFWLWFQKENKNYQLLLFYLMLGLGFLTKGPVVLIVPIVLIVYQRVFLKIKTGSVSIHLIGLVLLATVGLSWYLWLYFEDSQFLDYFLFKHTIERFATNTFSRSQPFWFYGAVLLGATFPWILIVFSKTRLLWQTPYKKEVLFMVWIIVPLIFFSLSQSKLILYILPIFPAIALLAVAVWSDLDERVQRKWDRVQFCFHCLILLGLAISPLLDPNIVLGSQLYFILVIIASIVLSFSVIPMKIRDKPIFMAYLFIMGITVAFTYFFAHNAGTVNDQKNVAAFIQEEIKGCENILVYDKRLPSISFSTSKNVISLFDGDEGLNRETQFEKNTNWKNTLINLKENPNWLLEKRPEKSVLLVKKNKMNSEKLLKAIRTFNNNKEVDGWVLYFD
ncbi:hypothetical protein P872_19690 [Rhodonellum psychrophilum GCM71 = DSM 17998]|uniref:Lipid A biosynthesis N-terminal domain-containing protein n=2 Tax=Rhodonellum TaxID=336827 RepID=U5BMB9_9BACT|nr:MULTISPECIES: lipid-A-disaccharide synthase N-terminal domain-containing protein [Rhodonellum]ERM81645.1 hypothetical protein P872_19690 [Rhodonellum psychrophilum GCM71 = DSM 17998]SDZ39390.1 4-amino-4-deoxy-L-arabinose transferase [Rhodonellum ikkaensis]